MNEENTTKLVTEFPDLYQQYFLPARNTCMCWGFECGDGWFAPVYKMSKLLTQYRKDSGIDIQICQLKEKFGELRVYVDNGDAEVSRIIQEAESACDVTCETCGKPREVCCVEYGWCYALCDECFASLKANRGD